jgi:hypothetical protein
VSALKYSTPHRPVKICASDWISNIRKDSRNVREREVKSISEQSYPTRVRERMWRLLHRIHKQKGGKLKGDEIPTPLAQDNTINANTMQNLPNNTFFQQEKQQPTPPLPRFAKRLASLSVQSSNTDNVRVYWLKDFVSLLQDLLLCLDSGLGVRRIWQEAVAATAMWKGERVTHCNWGPVITHEHLTIHISVSGLDQIHRAFCWERPDCHMCHS